MAKNRALGRGLDSIIADNMIEEKENVTVLRINMIQPRSDQPRKYFDREALQELADSIAVHGVIQPLLVRKGESEFYEIIAGERRWRAAKMAGVTEVPVIVVEADDLKSSQLALIENIQREDLNPVEEAQAIDTLMQNFGMTQEEVAKQLGKSRPAVANILRILELPDEVLEMVRSGDLPYGSARALLGLTDKSKIVSLAQRIINKKLSVRGAEAAVKKENEAKTPDEDESAEVKVDYYAHLERKIFDASGIQARLKKTRGGKSRIEIDCENNEDLEEVIKLLCGSSYSED